MKTDNVKQPGNDFADVTSEWKEIHWAIDKITISLEDATKKLTAAMQCLASLEHCIDEWNYELGLGEKVGALLDDYYGAGKRPE